MLLTAVVAAPPRRLHVGTPPSRLSAPRLTWLDVAAAAGWLDDVTRQRQHVGVAVLRVETAQLTRLFLSPHVVLVQHFLQREEQLVLLFLQAGQLGLQPGNLLLGLLQKYFSKEIK